MIEGVCDAIVPGSARVRPAVYVDALLARMPRAAARGAALAAFALLADGGIERPDALARLPRGCARSRSRRSTATSSRPASTRPAPGHEIDFNTPLATRLAKDWSYLGIG